MRKKKQRNLKVESFRFEGEHDWEYEIFLILSSARAWTSVIRQKNVIAVVILQRVFSSKNVVVEGTNVWSFIILLLGEGLTSFCINNRPFLGEKCKMELSEVSFQFRASVSKAL